MAIEAGDLQVKITADATGLQSGLDKAQNKLKSFEALGSAGFGKLSTKAVAVGNIIAKAFTATFSAVSNQLNAAIQRFDTVNNFSNVMATMGNSASLSQSAINKLQDKLTGLPTTLNAAVAATQRLVASNDNLAASTDMFLALNNAIIAGTNDTNMQASALEQMLQAYAKGKPEMQDWKTLLQAMPAQLKQIATAMGYASTNELYEALQDGKVTMNDFMATVMRLNSEGVNGFASFSEQARSNCNGVTTAITNMKTAIARGLANIMDAIGQSNVAAFFNGITSAINTAMNYIAAFIRVVKVAVAWISTLFGGSGTTSNLVKETGSASENIGSIASGANNAADGLGKASKAAKALNKQLASFDEMNVLREQTSNDGGGSGGSGGSGGGANMSIPDYSWANEYASGASDKIEKIFQDMMSALRKIFDFDKIKKSFSRFADDVKKFIEPIGKILNDVWQKYLKPFISWAGNDLLPAFLNALGGAVNFLGSVIGTFWDKCLSPFIDDFLVPIAQWTGGIIVNVLNWIGDSLRGLASNQGAIDMIANSLKILMETFIAYKTVKLATDAFTALGTAFTVLSGNAASVTQPMSALMFQVGSATGSMNMMQSAVGVAGLSFKSLGSTISGVVSSVINPATIAMLGVVAAMEAVQVITEYVKLKDMEAAAAAAEYNAKIFDETEAHQYCNDAIQAQIDLKNELLGIQKTLADATLALMDAQDAESKARTEADGIAQKYGMTLDQAKEYVSNLDIASGNLTEQDKELARAVSELESTEGKLREAQDKVTESKEAQAQASEDLKNQALKEYGMAKLQEMQAIVNEGRFEDVADALLEMRDATVTYTDENGKQCKIAGEDVKDYTDFVGDLLGKMDTDQSRAWNDIWKSAEWSTDNIKGALNDLSKKAEENGKAIPDGVSRGVRNNQGGVMGVIGGFANSISSTFKKILGIASPSKVFAESGKWIDLGLAKGITGNTNSVLGATSSLAEKTASMFEDMSVSIPVDLASSVRNLDAPRVVAEELASSIDLEPTLTHVVVNVGDEKLVDKVVEGINDLSMLKNKSVVNI